MDGWLLKYTLPVVVMYLYSLYVFNYGNKLGFDLSSTYEACFKLHNYQFSQTSCTCHSNVTQNQLLASQMPHANSLLNYRQGYKRCENQTWQVNNHNMINSLQWQILHQHRCNFATIKLWWNFHKVSNNATYVGIAELWWNFCKVLDNATFVLIPHPPTHPPRRDTQNIDQAFECTTNLEICVQSYILSI